jgi:hypothetical protein
MLKEYFSRYQSNQLLITQMRSLILPLLLFTLFLPNQTSAQATKKEQIAKALDDYFHLERENIHVHFDKKVFLTSEKVWFKGYVFHRKMNMPFFATTNIYASLIDSDGNLIETQLLYGSLASFSGFPLTLKIQNQVNITFSFILTG